MANEPDLHSPDVKMDGASLYREEIYTDRSAGTIRVMTPVTPNGDPDDSRTPVYVGEAQILTNMGPLPISFEIDAMNLGDAVRGYGEAAKEGIERAMRELQEMRRQASSSILVPGSSPGLGGMPPPGAMGGGKIKLA